MKVIDGATPFERKLGENRCPKCGRASLASLVCRDCLERELSALRKEADAMRDSMEYAWGIIANASGGDWSKESKEWKQAAEKWRDEDYTRMLDKKHAAMQPKEKP